MPREWPAIARRSRSTDQTESWESPRRPPIRDEEHQYLQLTDFVARVAAVGVAIPGWL